MMQKALSYNWWFDSHNRRKQSPWLLSTLSELEEKTKGMLKLIEEDADSFAQRAEMYYKKRPELVNMIEDLYRSHRSLAEQYDQLKLDGGPRRTTFLDSSFSIKSWSQKLTSDRSSDFSSDSFMSEESDVDDPEPAEDVRVKSKMRKDRHKKVVGNITNVMKSSLYSFDSEDSEIDDPQPEEDQVESKMRERYENESDVIKVMGKEVKRLEEENASLKAELAIKDEQKREVIRQLCLCVDVLKVENDGLKRCIQDSKKRGFFDFGKLGKGVFSRKFFTG